MLHTVPQPCRCLDEPSRLLLMLVAVSGEVPVLSSPTSGLPATWVLPLGKDEMEAAR